MAYTFEESQKELVYDLRQKYAEIVGSILEEIAIARKEKKYHEWFELLDDLHTEIDKKLNDKERNEYQTILKKTTAIIEQNIDSYSNRNTDDSEQSNNLKQALKELNMWLGRIMEKKKMFGAKEDPELF